LLKPGAGDGGYLAFIGRITPEKGILDAIEIARRSSIPLKIAAKVDRVDQHFFDTEVRKLLNHPLVEYIGEITDAEKSAFLGQARALLFPIQWPEPFGLAMIEAFACGTPVIAYNRASVPEVMRNGVTGFIVQGIEEALAALDRAGQLDRKRIRRAFEERFSVQRMADDYVEVYRMLLNESAIPYQAA
jgi:glycosyltransferase involved in cell wall biosynthesis